MATKLSLIKTALALACLCQVNPAMSEGIAKERCAVIFAAPNGESDSVVLESLSVLDQANAPRFQLPADAPKNVQVVQCSRDSLVPVLSDYKVIEAGYPLAIVPPDGDRVGVLEVVYGLLRFRMLEGVMTEPETIELQEFLDQAQAKLNTAP